MINRVGEGHLMIRQRLKRGVTVAAGVVTVTGSAILATGTSPALAATTTTSYSCAGSTTAPIALVVKDTAAPGSTVQVTASSPPGTASLGIPVTVSSWTGTGTATVTGDGSITTLPFSYTGGSIPVGGAFPGFSVSEPLVMPASGTVTVTMPTTFTLTFNIGISDTVSCTATAPGSDTITVSSVPLSPSATVTSVSGETVTTAARDGATVSFTGSAFGSGDPVTVSLVPSGGGAAIQLTTMSATAGGTITGSTAIPVSLPASVYGLTFADSVDDSSASVPLTVLGTPSCGASPPSGGAGTVTTVSCANFDPGATLNVQGVTTTGPSSDPAVATTADAAGNVSHSYKVNDPATTGISVVESGSPGQLGSEATFTFTVGSTGGPGSSTASQTVTTTVSSGPLDLTEAGTTVTLSGITINGTPQTATGNLNAITVQDFRGSTLGWTLNATATGFTGSNGGSIPSTALTITPSCGPDAVALAASGLSAFPSAVTAGSAAPLGTAATLCSAPAAAAGSLTGGVFDVGGALSLTVPAFLQAGVYTDTITLSLG
jgi:hypothetical protein